MQLHVYLGTKAAFVRGADVSVWRGRLPGRPGGAAMQSHRAVIFYCCGRHCGRRVKYKDKIQWTIAERSARGRTFSSTGGSKHGCTAARLHCLHCLHGLHGRQDRQHQGDAPSNEQSPSVSCRRVAEKDDPGPSHSQFLAVPGSSWQEEPGSALSPLLIPAVFPSPTRLARLPPPLSSPSPAQPEAEATPLLQLMRQIYPRPVPDL